MPSPFLRRLSLALMTAVFTPAAQAAETIKIGVMGDLSGYSMEIGGPGAVLATRMAVEDHKSLAGGMPIEVVQADFLNKPDVATQIARRWFDVEGVDAITDLPNTPQPSVDNSQAKMMKFMPWIMTLLCYSFSCALALYSTINGLFTIGQQLVINRMKDEGDVASPAGMAMEDAAALAGKPMKNVTPKKKK